jgi:hypothetical protein
MAGAGALSLQARRDNDDPQRLAIAFVLFSLGCSAPAAFGRSGLHELLPPGRYAIFMMPAHLAILIFALWRAWISQQFAVAIMAALVAQRALARSHGGTDVRGSAVPVGF